MPKRHFVFPSAYLKKLFLSYVLILIPAFMIFTLCTENLFAVQRRTLEDAMRTELEHFENQMMLQDQAFELQSLYLGLKEDMAAARVMQHKSTAFMKLLKDFKAYNPLVSEILVNYDQENLYAASGMSRISTYLLWQLRLSPESAARFMETLIDRTEKRVIPLSGSPDALLFHYPAAMGKAFSNASVNFLVSLDALGQSMRTLSPGYARRVFLELPESMCVVFEENAGWDGYAAHIESGPAAQAAPGYTVISADGGYEALRITTALRSDLLYARVNQLRWITFSLLALLLFFAMGVALLLSSRNARPIRQLARKALGGQRSPHHREDEISLIREMIDVTVDENRRINREVLDARATLGRQALLLLFHGVLSDRAMIAAMLRLNGLDLPKDGFAVALIAPRAGEGDAQAWLEAVLTLPGLALGCLTTTDGRRVAAVLADLSGAAGDRARRLVFAADLEAACEEKGMDAPRISLSRPYAQTEQIHRAYLEAVLVLRALENGADPSPCLCFEELADCAPALPGFPEAEVERFQEAARALDRKRLEAGFQGLREAVGRQADPAKQKALRARLQCLLLRELMGLGMEQACLHDLVEADPGDGEAFDRQMALILQRLGPARQDPPDGAYQEILAYLRQHYTDQHLTLDEVAAHVGLSKAYISRLFRSKGNRKYIDYLTDLRMREAMRLLTTTRLQIREITQRVGYWDVVSFQKKFKALYGVNPSEYRKRQTADKEEEIG